ncbi:hypothetical protein VCRA2123E76_130077 [Vibrio crassostreae]|nr:hypothetical protein VCRA2123E76_130077 [Vibrio crassostreae]
MLVVLGFIKLLIFICIYWIFEVVSLLLSKKYVYIPFKLCF